VEDVVVEVVAEAALASTIVTAAFFATMSQSITLAALQIRNEHS
jgi:hypothetical protein